MSPGTPLAALLELGRPDLLPWLSLAPAVALALALLARARRRRLALAVGPRAPALVSGDRPRARRVADAVFVGGVLAAATAALHPVAGAPRTGALPAGLDLVVALDVSRSMRARDLEPDRLGFARAALARLARRAVGDRLALVAFAGEAKVVTPLTDDGQAFLDLVERVDPTDVARGGTDLGAALDAALALLSGSPAAGGAVLLLTDGEDLAGQGRAAAARARARGVPVLTLGLGSPRGSRIAVGEGDAVRWLTDGAGREVLSALDVEGLRALAEATGGFPVAPDGPEALADACERHLRPRARAGVRTAGRVGRPAAYQLPLALGAGLFLLALALVPRGTR